MDILEAEPIEIKKTFGLVFYWISKFLKPEALNDVSMLYAFHRYVSDIASLPNKAKAKDLLGKLEEELDAPSHTFMVRLATTLERLDIEKLYAKEVISAARFATSRNSIAHHNQLVIYCYKRMGAFGLMLAPAVGARDERAKAFAVDLGIGGQLVDICANILDDARRGAVYLPKRDLDQLRLRRQDLIREGDTPIELKKLVEKYLDLADGYLENSMAGLVYLPLRVRVGVLAGIRACQATGTKIRRRDFEVLEGKIRLSGLNKTVVAAQTLLDILSPRFWHLGKRRAYLHAPLMGLPGVGAPGRIIE